MRRRLVVLVAMAPLTGCALSPTVRPIHENPMLLPAADFDSVWQATVDVVDDYFRIEREEPVRARGGVLTEGRIDTYPLVGATLLEPWRGDSVGGYERLESTLQTIRRRAFVRMIPTPEGYLVDLAVFKELEDLERPEQASAGAATFRHDSAPRSLRDPVISAPLSVGWIPLSRDTALEQRMLASLHARLRTGSGPQRRGAVRDAMRR